MIVCLEGIDGSGKTTHAARLAERLSARLFKFPNRESPTGRLIYAHLEGSWWLDGSGTDEPSLTHKSMEQLAVEEALVFQSLQLANRMEVATDIFEAAARGNVVFDRYWPSGYAYGMNDGLDPEYMRKLHQWLPQPDLFILIDVDAKTSVQRRPERRDRYEKESGLLDRVAANYRQLWKSKQVEDHNAALRWVIIDSYGTQEETAAEIDRAVADWREKNAK